MSRLKIVSVLFTAVVLFAACSRPTNINSAVTQSGNANLSSGEKPQTTSTKVVKVTANEIVVLNGAADAVVKIKVDPGYHVNANPPTYPYLKATELEIPSRNGLSVGFIAYPDPLTKKFPFADKPLAVYEGETPIRVRLKADKTARVGSQNLSAKLRVQACDEQVCYAPGEIDFVIPVMVK